MTVKRKPGIRETKAHDCIQSSNLMRHQKLIERTNVYFNNVLGNKVASEADVNSEYDWFWSDGLLKIYSSELADLKYEITYE